MFISEPLANWDTKAFFLLADATGHGIGPALSVTQVRAMFRIATTIGTELSDQLTTINAQLSKDLAANRFVTAFFGFLDVEKHVFNYFSAESRKNNYFTKYCSLISAKSSRMLSYGFTYR